MSDGFTLVHADEALLVLDKPEGLLSVPGRGPENADCLSARVQARYPEALIVHRLDQATSGLLVMARGIEAQRRLSLAFAERRVHKRYEAVVWGVPDTSNADADGWSDIHLPLIVDWPNRPRSKVDRDMGKPSHTRWRLQQPLGDRARLLLEPVTGRSHQLRVHLMSLGHPIIGDTLYAQGDALTAASRLLLHAAWLELPHPHSGQPLRFTAPLPF